MTIRHIQHLLLNIAYGGQIELPDSFVTLLRSEQTESAGRPYKKHAPHIMATQFANWHLADQLVTAKGAKTCLLTADKKPVVFQPKSRVTCPFGIKSWEEDTTRKNLEIRCTEELETFFGSFDEWAIAYIAQNSARLLKKELSEQSVRENYKSTLNRRADYPALLRTKVNTQGTREVRFWDERGRSAEQPDDWKAVECSVKLNIRSLSLDHGHHFRLVDRVLGRAAAPPRLRLSVQHLGCSLAGKGKLSWRRNSERRWMSYCRLRGVGWWREPGPPCALARGLWYSSARTGR